MPGKKNKARSHMLVSSNWKNGEKITHYATLLPENNYIPTKEIKSSALGHILADTFH